MSTDKEIKLSKLQKEIILAMRERENVFCWAKHSTKFSFKGKTVRYDIGSSLAYYSRLVKRVDNKSGYYTLTELGKEIKL